MFMYIHVRTYAHVCMYTLTQGGLPQKVEMAPKGYSNSLKKRDQKKRVCS